MARLNYVRHINYDPARYESPFEFKPERYLGYDLPAASYLNIADPNQRDHFSYGAGRRVCPGVHVAEKSLYLNISRIVDPGSPMVPGWMTIPAPFECDISVRSPKHAELIEKIWREAEQKITLDEKR
jgi:hypothetical protein